jgi:DtxR family transcriptional regulator, Mn-dependent transcriptional regulator
MTTLTIENYLKAILQYELREGATVMSTGQIAEEMRVSPGTVTSMLKTLSETGLADYTPYSGASLTEAGRTLAMRMLRRHRLIELFLVRTLDLTWDQVHEEAEDMEHAVSDFLVDRMDEFLGRPKFDPHGDPIPSADGQLRGLPRTTVTLETCPPRSRIRLVRVTDQEGEFLRFLSERGLEIGTEGVVTESNHASGVISLKVSDQSISLGLSAAAALQVEILDGGPAAH